MSIRISDLKCKSCGKCLKVCPGNLIYSDENRKAFIKYANQCWGCTACIKECNHGAIEYYLEPNIGGSGGCLYTNNKKDTIEWIFVNDEKEQKIQVDKNESNKY